MSSGERSGIFIAYHYPEKRWLDRVVTALQQVVGDTPIDVWDDRKLLGGYAWRGELAESLARSKVAMMIVSDPFLLSGFITRAKLPALLDREREHGLKICWVLAGYCLFSVAGLKAEEAGNGINAALDGLSGTGRDAQIADVARKVAQILGAPAPSTAAVAAATAPTSAPAADSLAPGNTSASTEAPPEAGGEPKRARRKRPSRNEPQALLPLLSDEPAAPVSVPPPPQPHLEFPAPKPQTHLPSAAPSTPAPAESVPIPSAATASPSSSTSPEPEPVESAPAAASEAAAARSTATPAAPIPAPIPAPVELPAEAALASPPAEAKAERDVTLPAAAAARPPRTPIVLPPMPPPPEPISTSSELPPRRAESPLLPALDAVVDARQESIDLLRRLARWLKLSAVVVAALSLPAALWMGLTHFFLLFGFALLLASLALFLHARIALLGQRLVGLRYTRSGLADELLPNRQREPLLRRAADILR